MILKLIYKTKTFVLLAAACIFYVEASKWLGHEYWSKHDGHDGVSYKEQVDSENWWNASDDGRYEYEEKRARGSCGGCRCSNVIDCTSASGIV